jgi:S-adenosylmethionine decarboxylase
VIFEGSEKKAEIVFRNVDLFEKDQNYWSEVVDECEAKILSSVKTDNLHAYLLSESSLFVWKDRILLITCGTTTLVHAVQKLTEDFSIENIDNLIFQRKNEYCGQMQKTSFFDDKQILDKIHSGKGLRLGSFHEHHLFLFHLNKSYQPISEDWTSEILTYGLNPKASDFLTRPNLPAQEIRNFFQFEKFFPEFLLDDFVFDPFGYSINGIYQDDYFTIHVTPQDGHSYVSFETSLPFEQIENGFLSHFLNVLNPESFDLIRYSPIEIPKTSIPNYEIKKHINSKIECGYDIEFTHYFDPSRKQTEPV